MAIWHFDVYLVPRKGIERLHSSLEGVLGSYKSTNDDDPSWQLETEDNPINKDYPNYWYGLLPKEERAKFLGPTFNRTDSWSEEALMFVSEGGSRLGFWDDEIHCQIDVRNLEQKVVENVLELARALDCVLVLSEAQAVIPPDVLLLQQQIEASTARAFSSDPKGTLARLLRKS